MTGRRRGSLLGLVLALVLALLAACGDDPRQPSADPASSSSSAPEHPQSDVKATHAHHDQAPVPPQPLRRGEKRLDLAIRTAYTPSAPYGSGTDDYRCFLLDPHLTADTWLTGTHVKPGNADVVHHVILFQVPPDMVGAAKRKDAQDDGDGWTCFGGSGLSEFQSLDDADWIGAWAPGGQETVQKPGYGVKLAAGSRIVMQVHYNLLAGDQPDTSSALLRTAPGDRDLEPLHTMLMPAPVELPCRPQHAQGPLCEREAAIADVQDRFGSAGSTGDLLHLLCGGNPPPGPTQTCTRTVPQPMTVHAAAGHMHLLGESIEVVTNAGTPRARTVLDLPVWDFDNQGSHPVEPARLRAGDTVTVTCRHSQRLRDRLPALAGTQERYVVWGEGTTDEMCLGILQTTFP